MKSCHCGKRVRSHNLCWKHHREYLKKHDPTVYEAITKRDKELRNIRWPTYTKGYANQRRAHIRKLEIRFDRSHWRARHRKLTWSLTFEQWSSFIIQKCYYCKCDLHGMAGVGLDRKDNSKGYEPDNVLPCCSTCNRMRNNFVTVEEFKIMIDALLKYRGNNVSV